MNRRHQFPSRIGLTFAAGTLVLASAAAQVGTTEADFHLPGTQPGDVPPGRLLWSEECRNCHGDFDQRTAPFETWKGSLMANASRDPLFWAQVATAEQDAPGVREFCVRCHAPIAYVQDQAGVHPRDLDDFARDGVSCHLCHSMVDPLYVPGHSPPEDRRILESLSERPRHYGNAMFVLDGSGARRGPLTNPQSPHVSIPSSFHTRSDLCGTCHDVGNVAVSRRPDGTYSYNTLGQPVRDQDPLAQFPLERTYTEWRLSSFAAGGVEMGGRFGGQASVVSSCQDCHMPVTEGQACFFGPVRGRLRMHDFTGAAVQVLDMIALGGLRDSGVDQDALRRGRDRSLSMLQRAATVEAEQSRGALRVRVHNQTGHKLPTGHIEGRRVWVRVRFLDAQGAALRTYGGYDEEAARLDEPTTRVYEMHVGLSAGAASATGLPAGRTSHMALADTIVLDTRIPPRGFDNQAFEAAGAPVVGHRYADGQYWDDSWFTIPRGAVRGEIEILYQSLPREYVEALRDGNHSDDRGVVLHELWTQTGRGTPIRMAGTTQGVAPFLFGDVDGDGALGLGDVDAVRAALGQRWTAPAFDPHADLDGSHAVDETDLRILGRLLGRH